jgi:hypothetical protein
MEQTSGGPLSPLGDPVALGDELYADFGTGTGIDTNRDGTSEIVVTLDSGRNCWGCSLIRVFGVTPAGLQEYEFEDRGVSFGLQDAEEDGRFEALAFDLRWEFLPYAALGLPREGALCHACSPGVVLVYVLQGQRYVEACRDHPTYYQSRLAAADEALKLEQDFGYFLGGALEVFGALVQMGRADVAVARMTQLLTSGPFAERYRREGDAVLDTLRRSLEESAAAMDRACPFQGFSLVE